MNKGIPSILNDLYAIDPSLKQHEPELLRIVQRIIESKPDTKFDPEFAERLRSELLASHAHSTENGTERAQSFISSIFMKKISFVIGGAFILILLLISTTYFFTQPNSVTKLASLDREQTFNQIQPNAFGALSADSLPTRGAAAEMGKAVGFGGGGGGMASAPQAAPLYDGSVDRMPVFTRFNYTFVGDTTAAPKPISNVYSRIIDTSSQNVLQKIVSNLGLGIINLNTYKNLDTLSVRLREPGQDGFEVDVNLEIGMINMYRQNSPIIMEQAQQGIHPAMLSDDELISIATTFMKQHGINTDYYGDPVIHKNWMEYNPDPSFVPDVVTVTFPEIIDGYMTYQYGGLADGLIINIEQATKRVQTVNNLGVQQYVKSSYDMTADIETLINRYNDQTGYYPTDTDIQDITIELGTPTIGLLNTTQYIHGQVKTLYVPAYSFPVMNDPGSDYYVPDYVVIPLASDYYGSPMPYMMK